MEEVHLPYCCAVLLRIHKTKKGWQAIPNLKQCIRNLGEMKKEQEVEAGGLRGGGLRGRVVGPLSQAEG